MSDDFVHLVEGFLKAKDISPTALGRAALGDPNFVSDLKNGRRVWPETKAKVLAFMRERGCDA